MATPSEQIHIQMLKGIDMIESIRFDFFWQRSSFFPDANLN